MTVFLADELISEEPNFLWTLYREHLKKPFVIDGMTMCGGCSEIEERIFACLKRDLHIDDSNDPRIPEWTRERFIAAHPRGKDMLEHLFLVLNELDEAKTLGMAKSVTGAPFWRESGVHRNFLKFIIMYIWDLTESTQGLFSFRERNERLDYLRDHVSNKVVLEAIEAMNDRYEENVINAETEKLASANVEESSLR